ncbi:MAG: hypothetical protein GF392_02530 [Candidatus Omnitrophica bacterium]|nr:hypothetical protein [Candidatus Omnitrophota bacterium]
MERRMAAVALMVLVAMTAAGCGSGVTGDKPVTEVKQEAKTMDTGQLQTMMDKYREAIEAKKPQIQQLQKDLSQIPVAEMMGEEAAEIKKELTDLKNSVQALTERMKIYQAELSQKR